MENWVSFIYEPQLFASTDAFLQYTQKKKQNIFSKELMNCKWIIMVSWLLSLSVYILGIYFASMYSVFFDVIIPNKITALIVGMAIFYTILIIIQMGLGLINVKLSTKMNAMIDRSLTTRLLDSYFEKNYLVTESYKSGELITKFRSASQIRARIVFLVQSLPIDIVTILITTALLVKRNVPMTSLMLIPIVLFTLIIYLSHDIMQKNSFNLLVKDEEFNTELIQSISNIETLKSFGQTEKFKDEAINKLNSLLKMLEKFVTFDSLQSGLKSITISLFTLYIFAMGAYLVINGNMAHGMLLVFNSLSIKMLAPFQKLASLQAMFEQGKVAQIKFEDLIDTEMQRREGTDIVPPIKKLTLKNVSFMYGLSKPILDNVSLEIEEHHSVAIVGNSGSGKTTLAKLVSNYYDINSGEISINNVPYVFFQNASIRERILYVPQNVQIFNGTVINNITLGRKIEIDVVEKRARALGFQEIAMQLPEGYFTVIGENGLKLSMGQAQMLNILRSTLTEYDVIIFDEVTNGLDWNLKKFVAEYLMSYGNIKIFITHDMDFAYFCNDIYCIDKGQLYKVQKDKNTHDIKG